MKKSLIAMATLAFAGMASAQSSVTLYGVADIWVGKFNTATNNKFAAGTDGVASSRIGFKGEEALGGGLKATFNFEEYVNLATGATAAKTFARQANVGLTGGFGLLKAGKTWSPFDDVYGGANSGFDSALSANRVWQNDYNYTDSPDAQIYYSTPTIAGFTAAFSTQLKGNTGTASPNKSMNLTYANGPVYVGVAYEDSNTQKAYLLSGSYDLGVAKLMVSYFNTNPDAAGVANTKSYQLGADIPMGALTLSVGYANSKFAKTDSAFSVAAAYALSKRTTVYTGYRAESVKSKAKDNDGFAIGLNHKF